MTAKDNMKSIQLLEMMIMVQAHHQKKQKRTISMMQNRQKYFRKVFFSIQQGLLVFWQYHTRFQKSAVKDVQKTPWNQKIAEDWKNIKSVPEFRRCDEPLIIGLLSYISCRQNDRRMTWAFKGTDIYKYNYCHQYGLVKMSYCRASLISCLRNLYSQLIKVL